ncbi:MAG: protein-glutamate O-methyltransferase CheR [Cyanophyceae cyanobacterium]
MDPDPGAAEAAGEASGLGGARAGTIAQGPTWDKLVAMIGQEFGLAWRSGDQTTLIRTVERRMRALRLVKLGDYLGRLAGGPLGPGGDEWGHLAEGLTVGESYFFRDRGQMAALRDEILPTLLGDRRPGKPLRLWSAGCSTGEEAYSLAMLVDLVRLGERLGTGGTAAATAAVQVLGTDLNPSVIARARKGTYGDWSFRMVEPHLRDRYFRGQGGHWQVEARIQQWVTFQVSNLMAADFERQGLREFDVILCRNVFVYFSPTAIAATLAKFYQALRPGGYLLTGHAELSGIALPGFEAVSFPGTLAYRRPLDAATAPAGRTVPAPTPPPAAAIATPPRVRTIPPNLRPPSDRPTPQPSSHPTLPKAPEPEPWLVALDAAMGRGDHTGAIAIAQNALRHHPNHGPLLERLAELYADRGQYDQAIATARRCLTLVPDAIAPCHVLARIAEERGNLDEAKTWLQRIVYLQPEAILARAELGTIYWHGGDRDRARVTLSAALKLLEPCADDTPLDRHGHLTAAPCRQQILTLLDSLDRPTHPGTP